MELGEIKGRFWAVPGTVCAHLGVFPENPFFGHCRLKGCFGRSWVVPLRPGGLPRLSVERFGVSLEMLKCFPSCSEAGEGLEILLGRSWGILGVQRGGKGVSSDVQGGA